ncbi:Crp/Fnr family transcriptional regulator [Hyphococcus sp.]|uniref:Crp/Fnr family transcriptional regulator n=1 Tax=Hyphococcus sp. TaxID=2038636 RepID=UPI003CCBD90F
MKFIRNFRLGELRVDAGADIMAQGASAAHFYTLYEGWTARRITLKDGRSQITNFALPGALLGLQAALDQEMDHSVEALTDVTLCVFPRSDFHLLLERQPELTFRIVWQAAREEHFLDANITAVGRKTADERIAYLFASLHERAVLSGMTTHNDPLDAPITQQHVADATGLSIAHTHRVVRIFAKEELIAPDRKNIKILQPERLGEIGQFEPEHMMPLAFL